MPTLSYLLRRFCMANKTEIVAIEIGEPIAEEMGLYIVDVSYKKEGQLYSLCYYVDKENGVGIDDCERFSRAVEAVLDEKDPIAENYTLEVSSPGVDRKLTKEREFLYYLGREVDVKLFAAEDGKKEFSGVLESFKDKIAVIDCDGEKISVPIKEAAYIKLSFKF